MANYVQVPAADMIAHLRSRGFHQVDDDYQLTFEKVHPEASVVRVRVYTSIPVGGTSVKRSGRDSIRVCTIGQFRSGKTFGIGKFPPVFRVKSVESVLRRIDERVEAAMRRGTEWYRENAVKHVMNA